MVNIALNAEENELIITWQSANKFYELVETAKHLDLRFNTKTKGWHGELVLLDKYVDEFSVDDSVSVDEYTKLVVQKHISSLVRLKRERRRVRYDLLRYPPLKGKAPHENFQKIDIMRAFNQNAFVWSARMGLGKSYMISAVLVNLLDIGEIDKAIIFTSNIGLYNVKNELLKFTYLTDDDIYVLGSIGDTKDRKVFDAYPDKKVYVFNYDTIKYISDAYHTAKGGNKKTKYRKTPIKLNWRGAVFFDECHLIGGVTSRRCEIINQIISQFEYRYFSSGTFADKYEKLYTPLRLMDESLVGGLSYQSWLKQYVSLGNKFSKYAINQDTWDLEKLEVLNKRLLEYSSKRGIECIDVPEQYVKPTILVDMSPKHREIYEAFSNYVVDETIIKSAQNNKGVPANVTNSFQLALLSCENPQLLMNNPNFEKLDVKLQKLIQSFKFEIDFAKFKVIDDLIETHWDEQQEKVILWYYHPATMKALVEHLHKRKPFVVHSELTNDERVQTVRDFEKSNSACIVMSIASANSSLTITEAKAMAFIETSWKFTDYEQGTGRIQRPGQDRNTVIYNIRFRNSIDCLQLANLQSKGKIVQSVMSKESLTNDDWKMIFNSSIENLSI